MQICSYINSKEKTKFVIIWEKDIFDGFKLGLEYFYYPPFKNKKKNSIWLKFHFGFHSLIFHYIKFKEIE